MQTATGEALAFNATRTAEATMPLTITLSPTNTPKPPVQLLELQQSIIELEAFNDGLEFTQRGNACGAGTVLLNEGNKLSVPIQLEQAAQYNLRIRYSNDTNAASEQISVMLNDQEIANFPAEDTGGGGEGWNNFVLSPLIDTTELVEGTYMLNIRVNGNDERGIEFDCIIFVPFPKAYILEDFENGNREQWWTPDSRVFTSTFTTENSHTGDQAFSIRYDKDGEYQFMGMELPLIARDLSVAYEVEMWVYGQACILLKFEDEHLFPADVDEPKCTTVANEWTPLRFIIHNVDSGLDLKHIKTFLFFIDPGDASANGTILVDDIGLLPIP